MANLLIIESSPLSTSVSNALTHKYVSEWRQKHPDGAIARHNVSLESVPYVTESWVTAVYTPAANLTDEQKQALSLSDKFISELEAADTILIAAPMHNFGIPASLKAWIDQVVRAGRTFTYTAEGPKGLLDPAKEVIVIASRGGAYAGDSPYSFLDQQEPYLRTALGFIGLTNLKFVYAENQARGPEAAQQGKEAGVEALLALV